MKPFFKHQGDGADGEAHPPYVPRSGAANTSSRHHG
jgi:hypothetical protein